MSDRRDQGKKFNKSRLACSRIFNSIAGLKEALAHVEEISYLSAAQAQSYSSGRAEDFTPDYRVLVNMGEH